MLINIVIFLTCLCGIGFLVVAYFFIMFVKEAYRAEIKVTNSNKKISLLKLKTILINGFQTINLKDIGVPFMENEFEKCTNSLYLNGRYELVTDKDFFRFHQSGKPVAEYPDLLKLTIGTFEAIRETEGDQDLEMAIIKHIKAYKSDISDEKLHLFATEIKRQYLAQT